MGYILLKWWGHYIQSKNGHDLYAYFDKGGMGVRSPVDVIIGASKRCEMPEDYAALT